MPTIGIVSWLSDRVLQMYNGKLSDLTDALTFTKTQWGLRMDLANIVQMSDVADLARKQREAMAGLMQSGLFSQTDEDFLDSEPGYNWNENLFR